MLADRHFSTCARGMTDEQLTGEGGVVAEYPTGVEDAQERW